MYSLRLLQHAQWRLAIPGLETPASEGGLGLRAAELKTHDISLAIPASFPPAPPLKPRPLQSSQFSSRPVAVVNNDYDNDEKMDEKGRNTPSRLYFILLTPSSLSPGRKEETVGRVERMMVFTGGVGVGVVLLMDNADRGGGEGGETRGNGHKTLAGGTGNNSGGDESSAAVQALMELQLLFPTANTFTENISTNTNPNPSLAIQSLQLLSHLTPFSPPTPLSTHTCNVLSDVFTSLRDVAAAATAATGGTVERNVDASTYAASTSSAMAISPPTTTARGGNRGEGKGDAGARLDEYFSAEDRALLVAFWNEEWAL
ncbi:MAG: hypothetical protein M1819_001922 [Sarea resinae]|nr:MAG: hypothetical protein M1819_001922 [Sarea resinae]